MNPKTYDEWLALSPEDKQILHLQTWNTYEREGIGFAFTAAGRLAISHSMKILDIAIGTYHGGEYLIHAFVSDEDHPKLPGMLKDEFEGFRIVWFPMSQHIMNLIKT